MRDSKAELDFIRELVDKGQFEHALGHAAELAEKQPGLTEAYYLLACACRGLGDFTNARLALRGVLQEQPDHAPALREMVRVLELMDELEAAVDTSENLLSLCPGEVPAWLNLGNLLLALGRESDASWAYREALALEPESLPALLGTGHIARALGQRDIAIAQYRQAIDAHPESGAAYHSLGSLKDYRFSDVEVQTMEALLERVGENPAALSLQFALGKAMDDRGDYDLAWGYYQRGNQLTRRVRPWDRDSFEATVDAVIASFTPAVLAQASGAIAPEPSPIFIIGMPRSGSTLVEQILASHCAIEATRELPHIERLCRSLRIRSAPALRYPELATHLTPGDCAVLAQDYLASARAQVVGTAPHFTDKMPNNFLHVGLIHLMFPQAAIIDTRRDPMDTCVANLRHHFAREQGFAYGEDDMAHYFQQYRRLMAHWDRVLPGKVVKVDYESLVDDTEGAIRELLAALGLPFDPGCLAFHRSSRAVHTASAEQVRQPIYTSAVGSWRRYERHLASLRAALEKYRTTGVAP